MSWIDEKKRKLETNYKTGDESNLTEKIKLLQKHQALQVSSMLGAYSGFRGGGGVGGGCCFLHQFYLT